MGSRYIYSISPIIANIVMEDIEKELLITSCLK